MTFKNPELQKYVENSIYIRSMDHLAILDENRSQNTECQFTYDEVISIFGFSKIQEIVDCGCAIIISSIKEPADLITKEMTSKNISVGTLSDLSNVSEEVICNLMNYKTIGFSDVIKICKVLGLDYRTLRIGDWKLQNFDRLMSALTNFERSDETWNNLPRFELRLCVHTCLEYIIELDFLIDDRIVTIHPDQSSCENWLKDVYSLLNQLEKDYIVKWIQSNLEIF